MTIARERQTSSVPTSTLRTGVAVTPLPPPKKRPWLGISVVIIGVLGLAAAGYLILTNSRSSSDNPILTYTTQTESFDVKVPLNGELKAIRNTEVRCEVEGQTTIVFLIPEGTRVNEGDLLITLASDAIKDKL